MGVIFREGRPIGDLFVVGSKANGPSERLLYGSAATNSTPSLAELATIHSTVYSPGVPVSDGLRSVYIYRKTARCYLRRNRNRREDRRSE